MSLFIVFLLLGVLPNINGTQLNFGKNFFVKTSTDSPYSPTPDWISNNPHYSTGAELADFNKDGWLDLVVSDGNDMSVGRINLYLNDGNGNLSKTANWQSSDMAYNGHLDVADVNGDGWLDVAVSYLGTTSSFDNVARVYLNNNGVFSSLPDWNADLIGNSFGVDFGDINNDGRPDLAVATGNSYSSQHYYHNLVYVNVEGTLEPSASWQSFDTNTYMGAHWVDADDDGWLDLAFIGSDGQEIQIYRNLGGILETIASWHTTDSLNQFGIMLTSGDVNLDGFSDLFATENTQLGGNGRFKHYSGFSQGFFETTFSWSYFGDMGSAVALADVNYDNNLDLATGGWWDNTRIFLNDGTGLPTNPSWVSGGTSVIEKIVFGNVGPVFDEHTANEIFNSSGNRKLFYLSHKNIQKINSVKVDGTTLDFSEYTYSREHAWVSINTIPSSSVEINYNFSQSLDMVITNWDPNIGNYLYYNKLSVVLTPDLECDGKLNWSEIEPGATVGGSFEVSNEGDDFSQLDWEIVSHPNWGTWSFEPESGADLSPEEGAVVVELSVIAPNEPNKQLNGTIKIVNIDNPSDYEIVSVSLSTPISKQHTAKQNIQMLLFQLIKQIKRRL